MSRHVYILTKDDMPYYGGTKKYHIQHKYKDLSEEDRSKVKIYYAANSTKFEFVKKSVEWLLDFSERSMLGKLPGD